MQKTLKYFSINIILSGFFFILLMIPPFKKLFAVKMFAYINPEKGDIIMLYLRYE